MVPIDFVEQMTHQQLVLVVRARTEIDNEHKRAIADLRREAVDLALAGASKVIVRNLDDQTNRKLVLSFLARVPAGNGRGQR
jgi:F-type H+-transporting ATPase subunit b